jgi:hypothetical protein
MVRFIDAVMVREGTITRGELGFIRLADTAADVVRIALEAPNRPRRREQAAMPDRRTST